MMDPFIDSLTPPPTAHLPHEKEYGLTYKDRPAPLQP